MSNLPQPPASPNQFAFSRQGFTPLQPTDTTNMAANGMTDIPLEPVATHRSIRTNMDGVDDLEKGGSRERGRFGLGGRRRLAKLDSKGQPIGIGADGEEDTLTRMGRIYTKILNFSIVTRYFLYVSPFALAIAIPIIVGATAAPNAKIGGVRIVWFFVWVEIGQYCLRA